jgi:hypothetical protein
VLFEAKATGQRRSFALLCRAPFRQRNYYEHIIRNEDELHRIRQHIINNPLTCEVDIEDPFNWKKETAKDYYDCIS